MNRWVAFVSMLLVAGFSSWAQTDLPESDDYESFEVEPPLLPNLPIESKKSSTTVSPSSRDPVELEKKVQRAKRTAADAELLYKKGVLSRMEVELRALRVVRLQADLESARLQSAQAELAVQQTRYEMGKIPKELFLVASRAVETAREAADSAAAARDRAEIALAEKNVQRQRKLAALGLAHSSDVARAEQKLADLKAAKN